MNESGKVSGCSWDVKIDLDLFWEQVERLMKDEHTPIIHFCNARFGYELIKSKENWFRYDLVWNKTIAVGFLSANKMPMRSHENIYVFAKKGARYNRIDIEGDFPGFSARGNIKGEIYDCGNEARTNPIHRVPTEAGRRCVKSIVDVPNKQRKKTHPTQKPVDLYRWLIERYSKEGDCVLDATAGSFTSVFTARDMGRHGIGIEKDETFYEKAVQKNLHEIQCP